MKIKIKIKIKELFASNKSSLILKILGQNTQTLQLFNKLLKQEVFTKVIIIPGWKALVLRPRDLIKMCEEE